MASGSTFRNQKAVTALRYGLPTPPRSLSVASHAATPRREGRLTTLSTVSAFLLVPVNIIMAPFIAFLIFKVSTTKVFRWAGVILAAIAMSCTVSFFVSFGRGIDAAEKGEPSTVLDSLTGVLAILGALSFLALIILAVYVVLTREPASSRRVL